MNNTTKIIRINQLAKNNPRMVFTSIYQIINYDLLMECFREIDRNKE